MEITQADIRRYKSGLSDLQERILRVLVEGPRTVTQIAEAAGSAGVSHRNRVRAVRGSASKLVSKGFVVETRLPGLTGAILAYQLAPTGVVIALSAP